MIKVSEKAAGKKAAKQSRTAERKGQERLPAVPRNSGKFPDLEQAAEKYVELRDERMRLAKLEQEAYDVLEATVKANAKIKLPYEFGGMVIEPPVVGKIKVHVERDGDESADE